MIDRTLLVCMLILVLGAIGANLIALRWLVLLAQSTRRQEEIIRRILAELDSPPR